MSQGKLKFDRAAFDSAVDAVRLAGESIDAAPFNKGDINADGCQGIAIQGYADRLVQISDLLAKYRELVKKDVLDFKTLGNSIELMERAAAKGFAGAASSAAGIAASAGTAAASKVSR